MGQARKACPNFLFMSSSSGIFSGNSRYAADFAQVIDRAVRIASLPISQMTSQKQTLQAESAGLTSLDTKVKAFQDALGGVGTAAAALNLNTALSDASVIRPTLATGALPGTYTVKCIDAGSPTTAISSAMTNADVKAGTFSLVVADPAKPYTFTPPPQTLLELATAINSSGAAVEATVVNLGTVSNPSNRISLMSTALGGVDLHLKNGPADLLTVTAGSEAQYQINGQPAVPLQSSNKSVAIAPGISVELVKPGTSVLTVTRSSDGITSALTKLAAAYNSVITELDQSRGANAGALKGQAIVGQLTESMRQAISYKGAGEKDSLAALGFSFDDKGVLSFDSTVLSKGKAADISSAIVFLGKKETSGFLKAAGDVVDAYENSKTGIMKAEIDSVNAQTSELTSRIEEQQRRVDDMQAAMQAQMAAADALIASLEQQVHYVTGLFDSMRATSESMG